MLFIDKLKLNNFKNIEEVELNFSKINLISGEAGNGKTAILQALVLLLCNYTEGKLEDYINWRNNSDEFFIDCFFKYLNKEIRYKIKCGKSTDRELTIVGEDQPYLRSDSYKYIADNILDPVLTLYSNISEQGKTSSLLFESPSKGLETIKKIFKIDRLNESVEKIKDRIRDNKENISIFEAERATLEGRDFEFFDEPELPDVDIDEMLKDSKVLEQNREIYIEQLKQFEVYKDRLKSYKEAKVNLGDSLQVEKNLKKELTLIKIDDNFDEDKLQSLDKYIITIEKNIIHYENDIKNYEATEKRIQSIKLKIKDIEKQIDDIGEIERVGRCQVSEEAISIIDEDIEEINKGVYKVSGIIKAYLDGECPLCHTVFDENTDDLRVQEGVLSCLNERKEKLGQDKKDIKDRISNYNDKLIITNRKIEKKKLLTETINDSKDELKNLNLIETVSTNELDDERKNLEEKKLQQEKLNTLKVEYDAKMENVKNIESKILLNNESVKLYSKYTEPEEFEITVKFDENEYDKLKTSIQNYNMILRDRDNIKALNEKTRKDKKKNEKEVQVKLDGIEKLNRDNHILGESQKVINKDFSSYIIDTRTRYLNKKMNEFFQRAYNGKYAVKFEQDRKGIGFYYSQDGDDWHSTITLSGFERQLFSIAFRLALTTLQSAKILILDEVDSDASPEKSLALYENLFNESKIDQFFIISHNGPTQEYISNLHNSKVFEMREGVLID